MDLRMEIMALEILAAIAKICAKGGELKIDHDWGFGTATISTDCAHTHIGDDSGTDDENLKAFIDGLHSLLYAGSGLSWVAQKGKE